MWWIGDWLNAGEKAYGEKYAQAVDERQAKTWANYKWVAKSVEVSRRREILSFNHHDTVASLEPKEQEEWLKLAAERDLTVRELRESIKVARRLPSPALPQGKYRIIYADPPWGDGGRVLSP